MPNYSFQCKKCSTVLDHHCKYEDRPEQIACECGGMASYKLIPPGIMTHSYLDGNNRFKDAKEAAKLNRLAAGAEGETKAEIEKEVRKTGFDFEKKGIPS